MNRDEPIFITVKVADKKMWTETAHHLGHRMSRKNFGLLLDVKSQAIYGLIPP